VCIALRRLHTESLDNDDIFTPERHLPTPGQLPPARVNPDAAMQRDPPAGICIYIYIYRERDVHISG